jgi:hypothetical protein
MSGRAGRFGRALGPAAVLAFPGVAPAQATWAHESPDRAMSSPGWMRDAHTPQVVANFAVIGTPTL